MSLKVTSNFAKRITTGVRAAAAKAGQESSRATAPRRSAGQSSSSGEAESTSTSTPKPKKRSSGTQRSEATGGSGRTRGAEDRAEISGGSDRSGGTESAGGTESGGEGIFDPITDFLFGGDDDDNRLAEDRDEDATVAVIDYFADEGEEAEHGDKVESILQDTHGDLSDEDIQRYRAGGGGNINDVVNSDVDDFGENLDRYVEDRVTGLLDGSSDAFEDILDQEDSKITTVNQSLGAPEIRIAQDLAGKLDDDPEFRERFIEYAGLESDASEREVLQALVDEVSDSRRSSEAIRESEARYDSLTEEARGRGITTVVSAGNYGRFADRLEAAGVEADDEFYTDVLVNDNVIAVGAVDDRNTSSVNDDTEAALTTPNAGTDVSADGVSVSTDVDGETHTGNGTSFSAPQVAGVAAQIAEEYPNLSPIEIQHIIENSAADTGLDSDEVGAGILRPDVALALAAIHNRLRMVA